MITGNLIQIGRCIEKMSLRKYERYLCSLLSLLSSIWLLSLLWLLSSLSLLSLSLHSLSLSLLPRYGFTYWFNIFIRNILVVLGCGLLGPMLCCWLKKYVRYKENSYTIIITLHFIIFLFTTCSIYISRYILLLLLLLFILN